MTEWIQVAQVNELISGKMQAIAIHGQCFILAKVQETVYAIAPNCPHKQAPLIQGWLQGQVIECPWHHYCYDLQTGENLYPRNVYPADLPDLQKDLSPLHCYPVRVEADTVFVKLTGGS